VTTTRTLLLLRHASAEPARPGHRDADRRLSRRGEAEADGVGTFLRDTGLVVNRVLCSPAVRATQTLERLGLDAPTELVPLLYEAGSDEVLELVAAADATTVLVVGHAPAVPGVVYDVTDPGSSSSAAAAAIADRFPPGTLARLEVDGSWADPSGARLVEVWLPPGRRGPHVS
jgi:phosphohistidine phosphatase